MEDWNVWDARNGNTTGPYSKHDASKLAHDLNLMVARNMFPFMNGIELVRGPFYPKKAK